MFYNPDILDTLRDAVSSLDPYTKVHSRRVGQIALLIGHTMKLSARDCEELQHAGLLHDLGKIAIDQSLLTKTGSLTDEEYERIKSHPNRGERIIEERSISDQILNGIRHHHEEFDGSGYPDGLEGRDIPLFGRVLAVADALDAMLSTRPYRSSLNWGEVRGELRKNKRDQFDPEIAEIALDLIRPTNRDRLPNFSQRGVDSR